MENKEVKASFWAIGGGKGGVGKSIVSLMLGASLARHGKKVVLVDADLGGSNLHTLAGIKYPLYTLADFINKNVENIEDIVLDTSVDNMKLICGADDILGIANPKYTQKTRIFNHLSRLKADFILLDLGAGTSFTSIDFFLYAPNKIIVVTPQITSIQNAYGFIKSSLYRLINMHFSKDPEAMELIKRASASSEEEYIDSVDKLVEAFGSLSEEQGKGLKDCLDQLNIKVIVNMVRDRKERNIGEIVKTVAKNYLSLPLENMGIVEYDKMLGMSINNMPEFLKKNKDSIASLSFYDIARNVIKNMNQTVNTVPVTPVQNTGANKEVKNSEATVASPEPENPTLLLS